MGFIMIRLIDSHTLFACECFPSWRTDWLAGWVAQWVTEWPVDWLIDNANDFRLNDTCTMHVLIIRLIDCLTLFACPCLPNGLTDWLGGWPNEWVTDRLTGELMNRMTFTDIQHCYINAVIVRLMHSLPWFANAPRLTNWLAVWVAGWVSEWLTDRLADCQTDWLTEMIPNAVHFHFLIYLHIDFITWVASKCLQHVAWYDVDGKPWHQLTHACHHR